MITIRDHQPSAPRHIYVPKICCDVLYAAPSACSAALWNIISSDDFLSAIFYMQPFSHRTFFGLPFIPHRVFFSFHKFCLCLSRPLFRSRINNSFGKLVVKPSVPILLFLLPSIFLHFSARIFYCRGFCRGNFWFFVSCISCSLLLLLHPNI